MRRPKGRPLLDSSEIVARWEAGETLASIAADEGVSRERIRQRLARHFGKWEYRRLSAERRARPLGDHLVQPSSASRAGERHDGGTVSRPSGHGGELVSESDGI